MATKERLPLGGANGISDCQSYRVKPELFQGNHPVLIWKRYE